MWSVGNGNNACLACQSIGTDYSAYSTLSLWDIAFSLQTVCEECAVMPQMVSYFNWSPRGSIEIIYY